MIFFFFFFGLKHFDLFKRAHVVFVCVALESAGILTESDLLRTCWGGGWGVPFNASHLFTWTSHRLELQSFLSIQFRPLDLEDHSISPVSLKFEEDVCFLC